jgi:hypothetical protein
MTVVYLQPSFFGEKERLLIDHGALKASALRYDSGVCALRLTNALGEVVALPFHGQQIWSVNLMGRDLHMRSTFVEPRNIRQYLHNYGAFLVHCGATAIGVPSKDDTHPLHGELPHAPYESAYIEIGEDARGAYIGMGGVYHHTIAFSTNYRAEPLFKLYADSGLLSMAMTLTNLRNADMDMMYMAHINFRPVDNGRLVYSAHATPEHVRIVKGALQGKAKAGFAEFLQTLATQPEKHHLLTPDLPLDPEIVLSIDYEADADGWAHSLQIHPDGGADYITHRPEQLRYGVRWIARTSDEDSLGLILPATSEVSGYLSEKAKGNVLSLPPHGQYTCEVIAGAVTADDAGQIEAQINGILGR